jgi:hypothetical protein
MMAVEGIGTLVQLLSEQLREQALNAPAGANAPGRGNANNVAAEEDTFTPSAQSNAAQAAPQDAGIFQVSQGALTAVTADILFAQANPDANRGGTAAQAAPPAAENSSIAQPPAEQNANIPVVPVQLFGPKPAGQTPAAQAAPTTNVQVQIQALNAELPALGLSKVEIQEIDSIATQIQNFNAATYTNLVNQFEALAQQATQQGAPNPPANASAVGSQKTTTSAKGN